MTGHMARLKEFQLALMFLTRLPVGNLGVPAPELSAARWAFPLVGVIVGLIGWAVFDLASWLGLTGDLAAILSVAGVVLATGGLHQDGLADMADGLGGGRDREHCLEIMRDSRIGSYGAIALILTIAFWISALGEVGAQAGLATFCVIGVLSRASMVVLIEWLPAARGDGLGQRATGTSYLVWPVLVSLGLLSILLSGWSGAAMFLVVLLVTALVGWRAERRIGGQTGDVLGASQCLSEVACWAVVAVMLG